MESTDYLQFVLALVFVLAMFGLVAMLARRFGLTPRMIRRPGGARRLSLVEIMPLDGKRRLVLLRRDDREHLVILGPDGETVVEAGIFPPPPAPEFSDMVKAETTEGSAP